MKNSTKRRLYFLIGIVISVVLLYALFENVRFAEVWQALQSANYWWLLPNIALIFLTMYQRAYRWSFMIAPIKKVEFSKLAAATWIGFMANNVLPLRLGEFVRAYSLAEQDRDITKSASLATIFVERIVFDLFALLSIFGVVLAISRLNLGQTTTMGLYLAITSAAVGLVLMLTLALRPEKAGHYLTRFLPFAPERFKQKIQQTILKFSRGLEFLSDLRSVTSITVQTILIWLLMGYSNYFVFEAFGLDLPLDASFVVLVLVSISILVPSSPGFVGVYHGGAVIALSFYGISREEALPCVLVMHAAQYLTVTIVGFIYLKKEHLSLRKLEDEASGEEG